MLASKQLVIREIIDIQLPIIPYGVHKAVCPWLTSVVVSRLVKPRFTGGKKISWYVRVRQGRLAQIVEEVGEFLRPKEAEVVPELYRQAVGAEQESATPLNNRELHSSKMVEAAGIEPASEIKSTKTSTCVVDL